MTLGAIMIPLSRLQIAETCHYCKRLYAAHTLAYHLFIGDDDVIIYVYCDPPPMTLFRVMPPISDEALR